MDMQNLTSGDRLSSPAGRLLKVSDIFVPRSNREKSQGIPAQFRNHSRKVVIFENGAIAPLQDVKLHYKRVM